MNPDQISSLVRTVLKIIAGLLLSSGIHNAGTFAELLNGPDVFGLVTLLVSLAWSHNAHSDTPPGPPTAAAGGSPSIRLPALLALACALLVLEPGCSHLQPGADPLVVNVERAEVMGQSTFDLVLHLDHTDRGFWATNAPAFHGFCQWLRQPQLIEGTNTLPRAAAMLLSLDDVKRDYKASLSSSNALLEALATFQSVLNQAQAWQTIVTKKP
jgi:hypothetical protein